MDGHQEINRIEDISSTLTNEDQTYGMLPIRSTDTMNTDFLDLHEYCLLEIFSSKLLTVMDLCSLAETCKRFKQVIQRVFPKEFDITTPDCFNCRYTLEWTDYSKFDQTMDRRDVARILKNFGSNLGKLSIRQQSAVHLIAKYCGDVKLKRLEIFGMQNITDVCLQLKSIFQERLLRLSLRYCYLKDFTPLDFSWDSLIELKIIGSRGSAAILKNNFANLERFTFHDDGGWYKTDNDNTGAISQFICRHKSLRILSFVGSSIYCTRELVDAIADNCEKLEDLTLQCWKRPNISLDVFSMLSLPNLRKLNVLINPENNIQIQALVQASMSLETVELTFVDDGPHQIFEILSRQQHLRQLNCACSFYHRIPWTMLTQLRKLCLTLSPTSKIVRSADLLNIIRQLTNLEELELDDVDRGSFVLRRKCFSQIITIVEQRSNVLTLKCRYNFNLSKIWDKNQKVKLMELNKNPMSEHFIE